MIASWLRKALARIPLKSGRLSAIKLGSILTKHYKKARAFNDLIDVKRLILIVINVASLQRSRYLLPVMIGGLIIHFVAMWTFGLLVPLVLCGLDRVSEI